MTNGKRVKRGIASLLIALLGFSSPVSLAQGAKSAPRKLTQEQKVAHLLDRVTYGIRPGDVERVMRLGWEKYLDEQMHPERIADAAVEEKVKGLESVHLSTADLVKTYPPPQVLREALKAKGIEPPAPGALGQQQPGAEPQDPKQAAENVRKLRQYREALAEMGYRPQQQVVQELQQARILRAAYSERQLQEVMTDFWFNHFNVFIQKGADRVLTTAYERDVIRPRVFGKFEDLLKATAESPAMLFYLDNWMSAAPAAAAGLRQKGDAMPVNRRRDRGFDRLEALRGRRVPTGRVEDRMPGDEPQAAQPPLNAKGKIQRPARGLNENYAREIMELHTLGVDGGYTQKDVQEVARCFTGWTLQNPRRGGEFIFNPRIHDDGEKVVLGKKIAAGGGVRDGYEVIRLLATHPSTARFISTKLARKFVADEPSRALVDRMAETFRKTDGDLRQVLLTMFKSQEFWAPEAYRAKIKTPFEMTVSAVRAIGAETNGGPAFHRWMAQMGEGLYLAQPPLYRLVSGNISAYARDDVHKEELLKTEFKGKSKVEISRFKGLGEMPANQLKETTMNPKTRILLRVTLPDVAAALGLTSEIAPEDVFNGGMSEIDDLVERLMGKNAEPRFQFIQDNAEFVQDIDV